MTKKNAELGQLRTEIEAVDKTIINALSKRAKLVEAVGRYKTEHKINLLDKKRRDTLLRMWSATGKSLRLPAKLVRDIFSSLHRHSLALERKVGKK